MLRQRFPTRVALRRAGRSTRSGTEQNGVVVSPKRKTQFGRQTAGLRLAPCPGAIRSLISCSEGGCGGHSGSCGSIFNVGENCGPSKIERAHWPAVLLNRDRVLACTSWSATPPPLSQIALLSRGSSSLPATGTKSSGSWPADQAAFRLGSSKALNLATGVGGAGARPLTTVFTGLAPPVFSA